MSWSCGARPLVSLVAITCSCVAAPLVGSSIPALVVPGSRLSAQETVVSSPEARLDEGARVQSPWSGIEFTVPAGYTGGFEPDAQGVVLLGDGGNFLGVWGVSEGAASVLADAVGGLLIDQGIQLQLRSEPEPEDGVMVAELDALGPQGRGTLIAAMRDGPFGNAIVAAGLGMDEATLRPTVVGLVRDAELTEPEAAAWIQRAGGLLLTTRGAESTYSPGGGGDGSYASRTASQLALCRNGAYSFDFESESYTSVMGAGSFESTSREAHQGGWSLISDLAGRAFLVLEATDGSGYTWAVEETDDGALINGTAYRALTAPAETDLSVGGTSLLASRRVHTVPTSHGRLLGRWDG